MKNPQFSNNQIYHIYNRGVEKRDIFMDDKDRFRFIHNLFEFNDEAAAANIYYKLPNFKSYEVELRKIKIKSGKEPRKLLIEILAFCLMPNHYHLLVRQKKDGGIVRFMQKLGTGYTNYFNKKYERVGGLFQGRFKAVLVNEEAHFIHLPFYIHSNPIDLTNENSKDTWKKQMKFLEEYRWSSFPDYIGKKNFPSVTSREFLSEFFGGEKEYRNATESWLKERENNTELIKDIILD